MSDGPIVLGLTGSIGMGKSTAADMLRQMGVAVFDADAVVHKLQAPGGRAVSAIARAFPDLVSGGVLDRARLAKRAFEAPDVLRRLEHILHPLVHEAETRFLRVAALGRRPLAVLDIPLLFESGAERRCDYTLVVTAPPFVQAARVLKRPGMTSARFRAVLDKQMSDLEKRRRADFVVPTGAGRHYTRCVLREIVRQTRHPSGAR